jgi:hypothetical protein
MRFELNGNFTSDAEGSLFSGEPGVWGTYRADGELLTITVKGGYGCAAGTRAVWRINLMPDERLSMVLVRGTCPAGSHLIWVARRVQHDVGLPIRPPGVAPTGPMALVRADDAAVCFGEGKPITGLPSGFPADFYFPDRTEIVAAEDQGAEGVHVIGITPLEYNLVLHELLGAASPGGWKVTSSSIGSGHAEAAWAGHGYRGRWAIRESDRCPSQVVLEVLARKR